MVRHATHRLPESRLSKSEVEATLWPSTAGRVFEQQAAELRHSYIGLGIGSVNKLPLPASSIFAETGSGSPASTTSSQYSRSSVPSWNPPPSRLFGRPDKTAGLSRRGRGACGAGGSPSASLESHRSK